MFFGGEEIEKKRGREKERQGKEIIHI
jgi:hypothetical protein